MTRTKQEEIDWGLRKLIGKWTNEDGTKYLCDFSKAIRVYLHSKGAMLQVEGELPKNPYVGDEIENLAAKAGYISVTKELRQGYDECWRDMSKAGFTSAIEPLI